MGIINERKRVKEIEASGLMWPIANSKISLLVEAGCNIISFDEKTQEVKLQNNDTNVATVNMFGRVSWEDLYD